MEKERPLQQLPLEGIQQALTEARDSLRRNPADRDVQFTFIATYQAVDQELHTPQRQQQMIDFAVAKYQTALPEVIEGKRTKIAEIARIQSLLSSERITQREREQLEMVQSQLLEPKSDLLSERVLHFLATLPGETLQTTYERIKEDETERVRKEKRNVSRVVQLTRIVKDITNPSLNYPVGWEDVTLELVANDSILETTLYEKYAGNIFELWSENENIAPRFRAAVEALRFKLKGQKPLTTQEEALVDTLRAAYAIPADQVEIAFDQLLDEENGLLRAWNDRELTIVEQEFSLVTTPAIDLDVLAERVHTEHIESQGVALTAEEQAKREIEAVQQAEHTGFPAEDEVGSSGIRRLEKDSVVEGVAKEIANILEKFFPEYLKNDGGMSQDTLMRKALSLPREYHFNINDVGRYVNRRHLTGERSFFAGDVIRLMASQLNNATIEDNVVDRTVAELQRKQIAYRIPVLLRKIGNIMTGGIFDEDSTNIHWDIVSKAKGLDRLSGFMEALSSGAFSASELQRFSELKTSDFKDVSKDRVASLQRVPNNIVGLLTYIYTILPYDVLTNQVKGDFEKIASKKVREMARILEEEVRSQKRTLQQEIASARTRMKIRR